MPGRTQATYPYSHNRSPGAAHGIYPGSAFQGKPDALTIWLLKGGPVGQPGFGESLIPVLGSGRSAVNAFEEGRYLAGSFHTVMAITDVFLVKALFSAGGKLLVKGGEKLLSKVSVDVGLNVAKKEIPGGVVTRGGTTVREAGNYVIKEVDPAATAIAQWWGRRSLETQARAMVKLGDMTPNFLYVNGKLIMRNAGAYTGESVFLAWARGSWRMGTAFNDIARRNMGSLGRIFDPVLHPIQESIYIVGFWGFTQLQRTLVTLYEINSKMP